MATLIKRIPKNGVPVRVVACGEALTKMGFNPVVAEAKPKRKTRTQKQAELVQKLSTGFNYNQR